MEMQLAGKSVAILVADGFEQSEFSEPRDALLRAGATPVVVSLSPGKVRGWKGSNWGDEFEVDAIIDSADAEDYSALVLPGGVMNPDRLRNDVRAIAFVRGFIDQGKPICAICHGPWTLIDAQGVRGRTMTSYPSIRVDLINAGARWIDSPVVVDNGLVTSRWPDDLPQFTAKMIEEIAEGRHQVSKGTRGSEARPF